ncbi:hypothetical protein R1flu_011179 [Riccia fluitans]|uniref:F-box/kelch-repeat protein n=1 Tax=Riccia fluitans TaxID=41844 RepID=A0ABD1ZB87_9MARC
MTSIRKCPFTDTSGVYFNGIVYFTGVLTWNGLQEVLTYDVERRCWGKLPSPLRLTFRPDGVDCKFMVCENQLVLLCVSQKRSTSALQEFGLTSLQIEKNSIILYKVDVLKGEFEEMYKGPEESILQASSARQYSDGDSILFCGRHSGLWFNVRSRTWTYLPSIPISYVNCVAFSSSAFQPGKNTYIEV